MLQTLHPDLEFLSSWLFLQVFPHLHTKLVALSPLRILWPWLFLQVFQHLHTSLKDLSPLPLFGNLGSVKLGFSPPPPPLLPWGYFSMGQPVAYLGFSLLKGSPSLPTLGAVFPGCQLSLQKSSAFSWLLSSLFLGVTGFARTGSSSIHHLLIHLNTSAVM